MSEGSGFGKHLERLRDARGWTRQQLAERACLSRPYISQLERGFKTDSGALKRPSEAALWQLADALGVPIEELAEQAGVELTGRTAARTRQADALKDVAWHDNPSSSAPTAPVAAARRRSASPRDELDEARAEVLPALRRLLAGFAPATRLTLLGELQAEAVRDLGGG